MKSTVLVSCFFLFQFCCSAQTIRTINAELRDTTSYESVTIPLIGGCSLGCAIGWNMTASSNLETHNGIYYGIDNIEDGDNTTAWVEGEPGYGIGEKIIITFQENNSHEISFYEIGLNNGYCKSKDTWKDNSRVKKAELKKNGETILILNFLDTMYSQFFRWDTEYLSVTNGDVITIEILEVYKGDKFEDTAISDLYLMGAH